MQPIPHPEIEQLRQRCRELHTALQETLREWFRLRTVVYPQLLTTYERHFRHLELELQQTALRAAQLRRHAELLVLKLQRGEPITEQTLALVERIVEREFAQLWERLQAADTRVDAHSPPPTEEPGELPKLYRLLVKRLHPDAVGGETEEFRQYWPVVQRAYQERNLQQLRQLVLLLCEAPSEPAGDAAPPEELEALRLYVRRLEQRLAVEQRRLEWLRSEEPFCLPLDDPAWCAQRRRELEEEIHRRRREIDYYTELLARIRSHSLSPEEVRSPEFARQFAEATYARR